MLEIGSASHYNDACKPISVCELLRIENNGTLRLFTAALVKRSVEWTAAKLHADGRYGRRRRQLINACERAQIETRGDCYIVVSGTGHVDGDDEG